MRASASNLAREGIVLLSRRGDTAPPRVEGARAMHRAVVVFDPYAAASELLRRADVGVLVVDLSTLTPRHLGLLRVARRRRVPVIGYGLSVGPVDADRLDGVVLTAREQIAQRVSQILGDEERPPASTATSRDAQAVVPDGGLPTPPPLADRLEPPAEPDAVDTLARREPPPSRRRPKPPAGHDVRSGSPGREDAASAGLAARPGRRGNGRLAAIVGEYRRITGRAPSLPRIGQRRPAPPHPPSQEAAADIRDVLTEEELAALLEGAR